MAELSGDTLQKLLLCKFYEGENHPCTTRPQAVPRADSSSKFTDSASLTN